MAQKYGPGYSPAGAMDKDIKRDVTGDIVFATIASGTTSTTSTSATVSTSTATDRRINFTKMLFSATGGFTSASVTLSRNGSQILNTATTGGTPFTGSTINSPTLTGSNTWTAKLHLTAGTPGTLSFTVSRNQEVEV